MRTRSASKVAKAKPKVKKCGAKNVSKCLAGASNPFIERSSRKSGSKTKGLETESLVCSQSTDSSWSGGSPEVKHEYESLPSTPSKSVIKPTWSGEVCESDRFGDSFELVDGVINEPGSPDRAELKTEKVTCEDQISTEPKCNEDNNKGTCLSQESSVHGIAHSSSIKNNKVAKFIPRDNDLSMVGITEPLLNPKENNEKNYISEAESQLDVSLALSVNDSDYFIENDKEKTSTENSASLKDISESEDVGDEGKSLVVPSSSMTSPLLSQQKFCTAQFVQNQSDWSCSTPEVGDEESEVTEEVECKQELSEDLPIPGSSASSITEEESDYVLNTNSFDFTQKRIIGNDEFNLKDGDKSRSEQGNVGERSFLPLTTVKTENFLDDGDTKPSLNINAKKFVDCTSLHSDQFNQEENDASVDICKPTNHDGNVEYNHEAFEDDSDGNAYDSFTNFKLHLAEDSHKCDLDILDDKDAKFPSVEFLETDGKAFHHSCSPALAREIFLLKYQIYSKLREMKQKLLAVAESADNVNHPLVYALNLMACERPMESKALEILSHPGVLPSEKEMFHKLTSAGKVLKSGDNGVVSVNGKVVFADAVHCQVFRIISEQFVVPSIKICLELLKDEFLLANPKILNSHKSCGCLDSAPHLYSVVLANLPPATLLDCSASCRSWELPQFHLMHKLSLLGRHRHQTKIKLIVDLQLYPDIHEQAFEDFPDVEVIAEENMTFPDVFCSILGKGTSASEDCLYVVAGGVHSILKQYIQEIRRLKTAQNEILCEEMNNASLKEHVGISVISSACDLWSNILTSTANSDVLFLPVTQKIENNESHSFLDQNMGEMSKAHLDCCQTILSSATQAYNNWTCGQLCASGYDLPVLLDENKLISAEDFLGFLKRVSTNVKSSQNHIHSSVLRPPAVQRFSDVVLVIEDGHSANFEGFINSEGVEVCRVAKLSSSHVEDVLQKHLSDHTLYVLVPNILSFASAIIRRTFGQTTLALLDPHATLPAQPQELVEDLKKMLDRFDNRISTTSSVLAMPFMPLCLLEAKASLTVDNQHSAHLLGVDFGPEDVGECERSTFASQLSQLKCLADAMMNVVLERWESVSLSPELLDLYQSNNTTCDWKVRETLPEHSWFLFNAWNSLLESVRFQALNGMTKSQLKSVLDMPSIQSYPRLESIFAQPSEFKQYEQIVVTGNVTIKGSYLDNSAVSYEPGVDFSNPCWTSQFLAKAYKWPSNTLFIFVLDVTSLGDQSLLETCVQKKCKKPILVTALPSDGSVMANKPKESSRVRTILERIVHVRKCLPNQSAVCVAPFAPQRVFLSETLDFLMQIDHNTLHNSVFLGHPAGTYPEGAVCIGAAQDWHSVYARSCSELRKPINTLLVNLNSFGDDREQCTFEEVLECNTILKELSGPFPARYAWKVYVKKQLTSCLRVNFAKNCKTENVQKAPEADKSHSSPRSLLLALIAKMKFNHETSEKSVSGKLKSEAVPTAKADSVGEVSFGTANAAKKFRTLRITAGSVPLPKPFLKNLVPIFKAKKAHKSHVSYQCMWYEFCFSEVRKAACMHRTLNNLEVPEGIITSHWPCEESVPSVRKVPLRLAKKSTDKLLVKSRRAWHKNLLYAVLNKNLFELAPEHFFTSECVFEGTVVGPQMVSHCIRQLISLGPHHLFYDELHMIVVTPTNLRARELHLLLAEAVDLSHFVIISPGTGMPDDRPGGHMVCGTSKYILGMLEQHGLPLSRTGVRLVVDGAFTILIDSGARDQLARLSALVSRYAEGEVHKSVTIERLYKRSYRDLCSAMDCHFKAVKFMRGRLLTFVDPETLEDCSVPSSCVFDRIEREELNREEEADQPSKETEEQNSKFVKSDLDGEKEPDSKKQSNVIRVGNKFYSKSLLSADRIKKLEQEAEEEACRKNELVERSKKFTLRNLEKLPASLSQRLGNKADKLVNSDTGLSTASLASSGRVADGSTGAAGSNLSERLESLDTSSKEKNQPQESNDLTSNFSGASVCSDAPQVKGDTNLAAKNDQLGFVSGETSLSSEQRPSQSKRNRSTSPIPRIGNNLKKFRDCSENLSEPLKLSDKTGDDVEVKQVSLRPEINEDNLQISLDVDELGLASSAKTACPHVTLTRDHYSSSVDDESVDASETLPSSAPSTTPASKAEGLIDDSVGANVCAQTAAGTDCGKMCTSVRHETASPECSKKPKSEDVLTNEPTSQQHDETARGRSDAPTQIVSSPSSENKEMPVQSSVGRDATNMQHDSFMETNLNEATGKLAIASRVRPVEQNQSVEIPNQGSHFKQDPTDSSLEIVTCDLRVNATQENSDKEMNFGLSSGCTKQGQIDSRSDLSSCYQGPMDSSHGFSRNKLESISSELISEVDNPNKPTVSNLKTLTQRLGSAVRSVKDRLGPRLPTNESIEPISEWNFNSNSYPGMRDGTYQPLGPIMAPMGSHQRAPIGPYQGPKMGPHHRPPMGPYQGAPMGLHQGSPMGPHQRPQMGPHQGPQMGPHQGPQMGHHQGHPMGPYQGYSVGPHQGPGMGPHQGPGMGPHQGPGMGPHQGPGMGPHQGPGMGPHQGPEMGPHQGPVMGPHQGPIMDPHQGPVMGLHQGPVMGPHQGPVMGPHQGPGMGPQGPVMGPHQGPVMGPHQGPVMGPHQGPVMGPHQGPVMGPHQGHVMGPHQGPVMGPHQGPGMGPHQGPRMGPHQGLIMGPHQGAVMGPHQGAAMGPHQGAAMGPHQGAAMGPHQGAAMGPHQGAVMGPHQGAVMGPHQGAVMGPHQGAVMGPHQGAVMGPHQGAVMGPHQGAVMGPHQGVVMGPQQETSVGFTQGLATWSNLGCPTGLPPASSRCGPPVGQAHCSPQVYSQDPVVRSEPSVGQLTTDQLSEEPNRDVTVSFDKTRAEQLGNTAMSTQSQASSVSEEPVQTATVDNISARIGPAPSGRKYDPSSDVKDEAFERAAPSSVVSPALHSAQAAAAKHRGSAVPPTPTDPNSIPQISISAPTTTSIACNIAPQLKISKSENLAPAAVFDVVGIATSKPSAPIGVIVSESVPCSSPRKPKPDKKTRRALQNALIPVTVSKSNRQTVSSKGKQSLNNSTSFPASERLGQMEPGTAQLPSNDSTSDKCSKPFSVGFKVASPKADHSSATITNPIPVTNSSQYGFSGSCYPFYSFSGESSKAVKNETRKSKDPNTEISDSSKKRSFGVSPTTNSVLIKQFDTKASSSKNAGSVLPTKPKVNVTAAKILKSALSNRNALNLREASNSKSVPLIETKDEKSLRKSFTSSNTTIPQISPLADLKEVPKRAGLNPSSKITVSQIPSPGESKEVSKRNAHLPSSKMTVSQITPPDDLKAVPKRSALLSPSKITVSQIPSPDDSKKISKRSSLLSKEKSSSTTESHNLSATRSPKQTSTLKETSSIDNETREFTSAEELKQWRSIEDEHRVYLDIPEMHVDFEDHYETFLELYQEQVSAPHRSAEHQASEWRRVWRRSVCDMLHDSWQDFLRHRTARRRQQIKEKMMVTFSGGSSTESSKRPHRDFEKTDREKTANLARCDRSRNESLKTSNVNRLVGLTSKSDGKDFKSPSSSKRVKTSTRENSYAISRADRMQSSSSKEPIITHSYIEDQPGPSHRSSYKSKSEDDRSRCRNSRDSKETHDNVRPNRSSSNQSSLRHEPYRKSRKSPELKKRGSERHEKLKGEIQYLEHLSEQLRAKQKDLKTSLDQKPQQLLTDQRAKMDVKVSSERDLPGQPSHVSSVCSSEQQQRSLLERQMLQQKQILLRETQQETELKLKQTYQQHQLCKREVQRPAGMSVGVAKPEYDDIRAVDVEKIAKETLGYNTVKLIKHIKEVLKGKKFADLDQVYNEVFIKVSEVHVRIALEM